MEMAYTNELRAMLCMARARKGQSSMEYIMLLSAVTIIIVAALAMMTQLKTTAMHAIVNGSNQSVSSEIAKELGSLTSNS